MNIFLIRHWESLNNVSPFIKDDGKDLWLSEIGKKQLKCLNVVHDNTSIVYVSPLARAIQSASILFPNKYLHIINEFRELDKWFLRSEFQNLTWKQWEKIFKDNYSKFSRYNWRYPEGESLQDLQKRVLKIFNKISRTNLNKYDNVYIVSHNWVIKIILWYILGVNIGYENLKILNASLIKITLINNNFTIEL